MWDRSRLFLRRAGTVILGINILLWFLATYPKTNVESLNRSIVKSDTQQASPTPLTENELAGAKLRNSFAGRMGRAIEPIIAPLGFDWKMGIGIITSFAAREVFVSTMSTVYNVGQADDSEAGTQTLAQTLRAQTRPDGTPVYTTLVAITLMVFYVFALQCASTVVVVRRETNSWKWPLFQWVYMGILAWGLAFITYQGGRWLGWG
jgi:ferrous iron transport protein B